MWENKGLHSPQTGPDERDESSLSSSRLSSGAWSCCSPLGVPGPPQLLEVEELGWPVGSAGHLQDPGAGTLEKSFLWSPGDGQLPAANHSPLDLQAPPPTLPNQERVLPPRSGLGGVLPALEPGPGVCRAPSSAASGRVLRPSSARRTDQRFPQNLLGGSSISLLLSRASVKNQDICLKVHCALNGRPA